MDSQPAGVRTDEYATNDHDDWTCPEGGVCDKYPGIAEAMDAVEGIQACDGCRLYPGDLEAAEALAARIPGAVVVYDFVITDKADSDQAAAWLKRQWIRADWSIAWDGQDLPDGVYIAHGTNPWVEVDGVAIDWVTYEIALEDA